MKHNLLLVFIISVMLCTFTKADDVVQRQIVATVNSEPIYLDEIKRATAPAKQPGDIKFVDPDAPKESSNIESGTAALRQRIKVEIISQEAGKRGLSPTPAELERELKAYAERQWDLLMPTEKERKEFLDKMRGTSIKILEGLTIWKEDKLKGDEFARQELEPLGMNEQAWAYYTENADNEELLEKLGRWNEIDSMTREELRDFVFGSNDPSQITFIENIISTEKLKEELTGKVSTSNEETRRLFDLLENTEWLEIVIVPSQSEEYGTIKKAREESRSASLSEKLLSKKIRLPVDSSGDGKGISNEYMLLASNTDSIKKGSISSDINLRDKSGNKRDILIYISDIEFVEPQSNPDEVTVQRLKTVLNNFKRDLEFNKWLNSQIPLQTKILIPEYKEAVY